MEAAHGFIDGNYLRQGTTRIGFIFPNPREITKTTLRVCEIENGRDIILTRCNFYDADPEPPIAPTLDLSQYWSAITRLRDTHLRFGYLRGKAGAMPRKQKGVDVQLAVDMLVGAFTGIMQVDVLISGDLDFVLVVQEVQRRGVAVVVAAFDLEVAELLRETADRFVSLTPPLIEGDMI